MVPPRNVQKRGMAEEESKEGTRQVGTRKAAKSVAVCVCVESANRAVRAQCVRAVRTWEFFCLRHGGVRAVRANP